MDGKVSELKNRRVAYVEVLTGYFFRRTHRRFQNDSPYSDVTGSPFKLPMDSPRDLKWQIRMVTCWCFYQNHRRKIPSVKPSEKVNICQLCLPSPPLFLFLLPNPNSPHLQTTNPPSLQKKSPSYQHNKLYFLKFCGHSIRVLIYDRFYQFL